MPETISAMPEYRKLPPSVTTIGCTPPYAMKKPESAPHSAATTMAIATVAQMFSPASLQSTPMMILLRPMIAGA